ncbi:MAG: NADH-quinone oxidoreductase subunit J [Deltaproteobacteria bacterium]|nr:NADH-quinone oxidoreductase subunit J [Deltaproteobacteria bacterium]
MATVVFYILAILALLGTYLCVTRSNPVHAILYLVNVLFAVALMYYLLGAPLVAAWEVIVYAGAVMVLFVFIIMMLELTPDQEMSRVGWLRWGPTVLLAMVLFCTLVLFVAVDPETSRVIVDTYVAPKAFGYALFAKYPLAVQVISFHLFIAAIGAYYLGRGGGSRKRSREEGDE